MSEKIFNKIVKLDSFNKDLKKLLKRFRTLDEDIETFIKSQLRLYHKLSIDNRGIFELEDMGISIPKVYKAKKFACRSLKGKGVQSGIRIIYAYFEEEDRIELIEIYYKGDKKNEDRGRLSRLYEK